jgi:HD-GYP domain-containing protein (c-di-GMP phosphodiesterase class II)
MRATTRVEHLAAKVSEVLDGAARAIERGAEVNKVAVRALAKDLVARAAARDFTLDQRAWAKGESDLAAHSTSTALVTAALALEESHPEETCVEVTAAALLHDVGHALLPREITAVPEPLLDDRARAAFRAHPLLGARGLFAAGCPALWVAAALEHHRGVDGKGYPELASNAPSTALVRLVSIASYLDRKRATIDGRGDAPDQVLSSALALEGRFFEPGIVRVVLRGIGLFPPGTTVELSGRDAALVVRANPADPLRPRVIVLSGTNAGARLELAAVDAVERRYASSIVRAIPPPLLLRPRGPTSKPPPAPKAETAARRETLRAKATPAERPKSRPPSERPVSRRRDPRAEDGPEPPRTEALDSSPPKRAPASVRHPARVRPHVLGSDSILEVTVNTAHLATLRLEARESIVLTRVDGKATVADLAEALKLPEIQLMAIVTRLLARGVVRWR